jgi:hypothetical protein
LHEHLHLSTTPLQMQGGTPDLYACTCSSAWLQVRHPSRHHVEVGSCKCARHTKNGCRITYITYSSLISYALVRASKVVRRGNCFHFQSQLFTFTKDNTHTHARTHISHCHVMYYERGTFTRINFCKCARKANFKKTFCD